MSKTEMLQGAAAVGVSPRTVGYVVWGAGGEIPGVIPEDGKIRWLFGFKQTGERPTIFPTLQLAVEAVYRAGSIAGYSMGSLTIKRVVETTYSETRTEYVAL